MEMGWQGEFHKNLEGQPDADFRRPANGNVVQSRPKAQKWRRSWHSPHQAKIAIT